MPKTANYHIERTEILGVKVLIATYQIADKFFCHIQNEDPGATIARAEGRSQEEAKRLAVAKVTKKLQ